MSKYSGVLLLIIVILIGAGSFWNQRSELKHFTSPSTQVWED